MALSKMASWSSLRGLGNSTIARATMFVPVVGYLLIFNQSVVSWMDSSVALGHGSEVVPASGAAVSLMCTHAWRLVAIYYGLTCTAIATLVFSIWCPFAQKKYADPIDYALDVVAIFKNTYRWTSLADGILQAGQNPRASLWGELSKDLRGDLTLRSDEINSTSPPVTRDGVTLRTVPDDALIIGCLRLQYRLTDLHTPIARLLIFVLFTAGILLVASSAIWGATEVTSSVVGFSMPSSPFCSAD